MGIFREWIQNIVVFLLITAMAGQLIPDEKYKKYIRLTMGLLLIMVILMPLIRLMGMDEEICRNFVKESLRISSEDARTENAVFQENTQIMDGYKNTVSKEVEAYFDAESIIVRYCHVEVNEERTEEHYGEISGLRIGLLPKGRAGTAESNKSREIESVDIPEVRIGKTGKEREKKFSVPEEKSEQWLKDLSLQFGVDRERIELEILS